MSDKLNAIARKIYEEGLEKAQQVSEVIIEKARSDSQKIISDARLQAEQILNDARKSAEKEKQIVLSEVKLASDQALDTLRQKIKQLIANQSINSSLENSFKSDSFIRNLILEIAKNWNKESGFALELDTVIGKKLETEIKTSLSSLIKDVQVDLNKNIEAGFKIIDKKEGFEIEFSESQFKEFLKPFIKEKTQKLLFE